MEPVCMLLMSLFVSQKVYARTHYFTIFEMSLKAIEKYSAILGSDRF